MVMVIIDERHIVFANRRVLKMLGWDKPESVCGMRPGDAGKTGYLKRGDRKKLVVFS
jgi:PAS domain-containing protein